MTINRMGNRCGHNKNAPTIYIHPRLNKRPELISRAKFRVSSINDRAKGYKNYFHSLKNYRFTSKKTCRKTRSESREAFALLCSAILDRLDLETMALGRWMTDGEFQSYSYDDIYQTMLEALPAHVTYSERRFYRHIKLMKGAGYLRSKRRRYDTGLLDDKGERIYREDVSVKFITKRFLNEMGFQSEQIDAARLASRQRNEKTREKSGLLKLSDAVLNTAGRARKWYKSKVSGMRKKTLQSRAEWNQAVHELILQGITNTAEITARIGPCPT